MPSAAAAPGSRFRRIIRWALLLALLGAILRIGGCLDRLFFLPSRDLPARPPAAEDVFFPAPDGVKLHGWLLKPAGSGPFPVVIHCHGNAGNVESHAPFSDFLPDDGFAVLLFDYRGYGRSDDVRPTRAGLVLDARGALDFVRSRPDLDHDRIGALGVSLGGAFASRLAAEHPEVRALVLVSAFTGWADIASDVVPVLGRLLVRRGTDPLEQVAALGTRPLLVVHGQQDSVIPFRHGERLAVAARAAGVPAALTPIPGANHNDVMEHPAARDAVRDFFRRTLAPGPPVLP